MNPAHLECPPTVRYWPQDETYSLCDNCFLSVPVGRGDRDDEFVLACGHDSFGGEVRWEVDHWVTHCPVCSVTRAGSHRRGALFGSFLPVDPPDPIAFDPATGFAAGTVVSWSMLSADDRAIVGHMASGDLRLVGAGSGRVASLVFGGRAASEPALRVVYPPGQPASWSVWALQTAPTAKLARWAPVPWSEQLTRDFARAIEAEHGRLEAAWRAGAGRVDGVRRLGNLHPYVCEPRPFSDMWRPTTASS